MSSEKNVHANTEQAIAGIKTAIENLTDVENMLKTHQPCGDVVNRLTGILLALVETRSVVATDHLATCGPLTEHQANALIEVTSLFQQRVNKSLSGSHH